MARTEKITCDVCGREKQQVNHWWAVYVFHQFEIMPMEQMRQRDIEPKHVCGQECAHKILAEFLQNVELAAKTS